MNENIKKLTAAAVSISMAIACVAGCGGKKAETAQKQEIRAEVIKAEEMAAPEHSKTAGKNETVYIIKSGDKTVKTIVSEWLKNPAGSASMNDVADLNGIEVVKGDARLEKNENGRLSWNAAGGDIYYSGTTSKAAPVDVDITYMLDGAKINASELKGKSGHLVITVNYKNTLSKNVTGKDGKEYTVYMPFIMSTGMILDNAKFSNITVTNGEAVNDGDHTMVMGVGFPGLYKSLGLDTIDLGDYTKDGSKDEKVEIPESVTIECDVKDCDEMEALTLGKVFDLSSLDKKADADKLGEDADEMNDGMKKLIDGSDDLHDGISKVNDGANSLKKGAKSLSDGAGTLAKGADKLASGTNSLASGASKVSNGANSVLDGMKKLNSYLPAIKKGVADLSDGTKSLKEGASKLTEQDDALKGGAKSLDEGLSTLKEKLPSADDAKALASGSASVKKTIDSMYSATEKVSVSEKDIESLTVKLAKLVEAGELDEGTMKQMIAVYKSYAGLEKGVAGLHKNYGSINKAVAAYPSIVSGVASASKGAKSLDKGVASYTAGVDKLASGISQVDSGVKKFAGNADQLAKGAEQLVNGAKTLSAGAKQVSDGASTVNHGAKELSSGAGSLAKGAKKLSNGTNTLAAGTKKLLKGSDELRDGLKKFDDKAVDKITGLIKDNIAPLSDRFEAVKTFADTYSSFAGADTAVECSTVFIFKND